MSGRLARALEHAARFGADPAGGITRPAFSPALAEVTAWVAGELAELGLETETDAAGNLLARWPAGSGPAVLAASHLDTVPRGGAYDGALGVLAAVEAVRLLREAGFTPARPVWVGSFMDEEGARFGTALFGSRSFCGEDMGAALAAADAEGVTVEEAMRAAGLDPARLGEAARVGEVGAYVELHIEQGPVLEASGVPLAVVEAIVGLLGFSVELEGEANHAGTTPMDARRDALAAGALIALAVRDYARGRDGVVATVGDLEVSPGARNVVPGRCRLSVDVRAADPAALAAAEAWLGDAVASIAREEGVAARVERVYALVPTAMDAGVSAALEAAARAEGVEPARMPSGAGHDAMAVARHAAAGMLFVPSRGGISHSPAEWTDPEHAELGARVLAGAIRRLAG